MTITKKLLSAGTALACAALSACSGDTSSQSKLGTSQHASHGPAEIVPNGCMQLASSNGIDNPAPAGEAPHDFLIDEILPRLDDCSLGSVLQTLTELDESGRPVPRKLASVAAGQPDFQCRTETAVISEAEQIVSRTDLKRAGTTDFYRMVIRSTCQHLDADGNPIFQDDQGNSIESGFELLFSPLGGTPGFDANAGVDDQAACQAELDAQGCSPGGDRNTSTCDFRELRSCSDEELVAAGHEFSSDFGNAHLKPCFDQQGQIFPDSSQKRCFTVDDHSLMSAPFEAMAFGSTEGGSQPVDGVFNFYDTAGSKIAYRGSSHHFQALYEDISDIHEYTAATEANAGSRRNRCGACHQGGGMVMKELPSPWVHWEHFVPTPGVQSVISENAEFFGTGGSFDGAALEGVVNQANRHINRTRIERLLGDGTAVNAQALLRPLFCPTELNFGSSGGSSIIDDSDTTSTMSFSTNLFIDSMLGDGFNRFNLSVPHKDYRDARVSIDQEVPRLGVPDTMFENTFIERAGIDNMYIGVFDRFPVPGEQVFGQPSSLIAMGLLRPEVARAVLSYDMTRPMMSDRRCALVEHLPTSVNLTSAPHTVLAGAIGDAVTAELASDALSTNHRADLENLQSLLAKTGSLRDFADKDLPLSSFGPQTKAEAEIILAGMMYGQACSTRATSNSASFAREALTISHDRINTAEEMAFTEFPMSLADSSVGQSHGQLYFDALTCALGTDGDPRPWSVDFCDGVAESGAYCFDPMADDPNAPTERPALGAMINCEDQGLASGGTLDGAPTGDVDALNTSCFPGCRRMAQGFPDQCSSQTLKPDFNTCSATQGLDGALQSVIAVSRVESFCDGQPTDLGGRDGTGGKDRFTCGEFGSAERLWCKSKCSGDYMTLDGNGLPALVDANGDGVITAHCE